MITMTEFIEKVDAIMGQKNMDDKKANQLCHLYAMILKNGYNACVEETAVWLKAMLWKNPKTRQEELVQAARKEYPEWEEAQCHYIDGAHYADAHPHWISVDELPKIGKDVLVLREDGEMQVAHQYNEEIARWWSVDGFPLKNNITHWMPMPEAPLVTDLNKKICHQ